jgi:hypothetical protein
MEGLMQKGALANAERKEEIAAMRLQRMVV